MPSRKLEDLHPLVVEKAGRLIELARVAGIEILVTSTLRTFDEQAELFAIGRTKPGDIVTNAKAGESWHNFGLAFDVVPLVNGKAIWDSPFWNRIGDLGKQAEDGETDDEAVGTRIISEAECRFECLALPRGQPLPQLQHRRAQLM